MKKFYLWCVTISIFIFITGYHHQTYAFTWGNVEIEVGPYIKGGSIAWDELDGIGGHKFLIAGGLDTRAAYRSFAGFLNLEKWLLGEGLDDDKGIIPKDGYSIAGGIEYRIQASENLTVFPYTMIGFERWDRSKEREQTGGVIYKEREPEDKWSSLDFFSLVIGAGTEYHKGYVKLGAIIPFSADTDCHDSPKSKMGFYAEGGLKYKGIVLGLFFEHIGFEDPDAKMTQSGVLLGYRFR